MSKPLSVSGAVKVDLSGSEVWQLDVSSKWMGRKMRHPRPNALQRGCNMEQS